MKSFNKIVATGALFLSVVASVVPTTQAAWFSKKKDDAQTCKTKFENQCQVVETAKSACSDEFSDFYSSSSKLRSDLQDLKESQVVSEKIFNELQAAYEAWKADGFRIDTQSYTDYAILKSKFADQNREVSDRESLVSSEMKELLKLINSGKAKQAYVSALDNALEAYYNYSAAAARESLPTV